MVHIFGNLNLTSISYSFWNITRKVLKKIKKIDRRAEPPDKMFGREPSNDYFIKILFLLSKWFQTRRFLREFPIGSYVKLSSAGWKRTNQESFQQSLVEIGSVVSVEKIFFKFHPPFFLICIIGQNRQKFKVHKKSRNIC